MITSLGADIIKVSRLKRFEKFSKDKLLKIFSEQELNYCFSEKILILQRLAVCFSVKEAFFKALSSTLVKLNLTEKTFSFMFACKHVCFSKTTWDVPVLKINWKEFENKIGAKLPEISAEVSISHEKDYAYSCVILHKTGELAGT